VMDRLKGVIGFYRTDTTGQLIRTADGQPIVSDEFSALGATAPEDDLIELIGESQTGTDLEKFAERITAYLDDRGKAERLPPEVRVAA
ncbi:MAG: hypothetical protein KDK34_14525, partial [Leptospiraceae bacterium]|nr:hypothetical protein [Leptospiraceae bacterium]